MNIREKFIPEILQSSSDQETEIKSCDFSEQFPIISKVRLFHYFKYFFLLEPRPEPHYWCPVGNYIFPSSEPLVRVFHKPLWAFPSDCCLILWT